MFGMAPGSAGDAVGGRPFTANVVMRLNRRAS
jgi:hypothetical protein